ncbi:MAG: hypothetical protein FWG29_05630 [Treponema sp.]|nr:hypothetical protein [Treponema sp.]
MLTLKIDDSKLPALLKSGAKIPDDIFDKAFKRAAKKAIEKAKAETKRQIADQYTMPAGVAGSGIETRWMGDTVGMFTDRVMPEFTDLKGVKHGKLPKSDGRALVPGTVEVIKGRKFNHSRILAGKLQRGQTHTRFYKRDRNNASILRRYHSPSVAGIFNANDQVNKPVADVAMEKFQDEFIRQVENNLFKN